jgi:hypothetical protein
MFIQRGDVESQIPHGSFLYERGSFSAEHWSGTLTGGLAKHLDYAFTAYQFRSTGEFANDVYRITTGTANIGYHFSDTTVPRAVYREFDSYTGVPGPIPYTYFVGLVPASTTVAPSGTSLRVRSVRVGLSHRLLRRPPHHVVTIRQCLWGGAMRCQKMCRFPVCPQCYRAATAGSGTESSGAASSPRGGQC